MKRLEGCQDRAEEGVSPYSLRRPSERARARTALLFYSAEVQYNRLQRCMHRVTWHLGSRMTNQPTVLRGQTSGARAFACAIRTRRFGGDYVTTLEFVWCLL